MARIGAERVWLERALRAFKRIIPAPLFRTFLSPYHYLLAILGALVYRFPGRRLFVVAITGTKGKTSTSELVNAILETAGYKTALVNTVRFKIGEESEPNLFKMSLRGRFFVQRFLRMAVDAGCSYAIIEVTSEAAKQFRHKYLFLDALIFTNIAPEHIEAHGSFEQYLAAKLSIKDELERSPKSPKWMIANADNEHADAFLDVRFATPVPVSQSDAEPYRIRERLPASRGQAGGIDFTFDACYMHSPLRGGANLDNILAAATFAKTQGVPTATIKTAIERLSMIPGRGECIEEDQPFVVVIDYAHTPESLEQLYKTYATRRKICVLGATGGGRDQWKRERFGELADRHCDSIILTDEDPYDEDPEAIVRDIARAIQSKRPHIELDRRLAIRRAIAEARLDDVVLITGKGTDPFIMGPRGTKRPWSDAEVARQELRARAKHGKRVS